MDVLCTSGLSAAGFEWTLAGNQLFSTVVAKATYLLSSLRSSLAKQQEPIVLDADPDGLRPDDGAPFKHRAEALLIGSIFAAPGAPSTRVIARVLVGEVDKSVCALADRYLTGDGELVDGPPFSRMPLSWERAARGPNDQNPLGVAANGVASRRKLPNLVLPGSNPRSDGSELAPAGFGPVPPKFPARVARSRGVVRGERGRLTLAADVDPDYFQSAPEDQWQKSAFQAEPRIILEHLHPQHERLVTTLDPLFVAVDIESNTGRHESRAMTADTLVIDTDRAICTITYRINFSVAAAERIRATVRSGKTREELEIPQPHRRPSMPSEILAEESLIDDGQRLHTTELQLDGETAAERVAAAEALPFGKGPQADGRRRSSTSRAEAVATTIAAAPSTETTVLPVLPDEPGPPMTVPLTSRPIMALRSTGPSGGATTPNHLAGAPPAAIQPPAHVPPPMVSPASVTGPPAIVVATSVAAPAATAAPARVAGAPAIATGAASHLAGMPSAMLAVRPELVTEKKPDPLPPARVSLGNARPESAANASDLAADARPRGATPAIKAEKREPREVLKKSEFYSQERLELLHIDDALAPELKTRPAFNATGTRSRRGVLDASAPAEADEPRIAVLRALTGVAPVDSVELDELAQTGADANGRPPLVVISGELVLRFDEREALRAAVGCAAPFLPLDRSLKEASDFATVVLESEWSGAFSIDTAMSRLRDALSKASRDVPKNTMDATVQRMLLERRKFRTAVVLGAERVRTDFVGSDGRSPVPLYLPIQLKEMLPLFERLPILALVEVRPRQDGAESHPDALLARAVARRVGTKNRH